MAHKYEYYQTPLNVISHFLDEYHKREGLVFPLLETSKVYDPFAGGDKDNVMPFPTVLTLKHGCNVDTNDIREDSPAETCFDFLKAEDKLLMHMDGYDFIITNPPFSKAIEAFEQCFKISDITIFLLRSAFLSSKKRKVFHDKHLPIAQYVLSSRPSFTGGGTDSYDYSFFVYHRDIKPDFTRTYVI